MEYTKKDLTQSINRLNDLVEDIVFEFNATRLSNKTRSIKDKKDLIKFEIMKYLYDYENEIRLINNELSKDFGEAYDSKLKNDEAFIYERIDKLIDCSNKICKKNQIDNINENNKRYFKGVK